MSLDRFTFRLTPSETGSLFDSGVLQIDRYIAARNCLSLNFCTALRDPKELTRVSELVASRFSQYGAELVVDHLSDGAAWFVYNGRYQKGEPFASSITIPAEKTRALWTDLGLFRTMVPTTAEQPDVALAALEKAYARATNVKDILSSRQVELIQSKVLSLLEFIRIEEPNRARARETIHHYASLLKDPPPLISTLREVMPQLLQKFFLNGHRPGEKSTRFYNAVERISRLYAGLADIESSLDAMGDAPPSLPVVQTVVDAVLR